MAATRHSVSHSKLRNIFSVLTFLNFNRPKFEDVCLRDKLNDSNRSRAVKMRGLPWKVTVDEIIEFYKNGDYTVKPEDVVIERQDGKVTGFGLAFLATDDDAEGAIDSLNREHIGTRFILLSTP